MKGKHLATWNVCTIQRGKEGWVSDHLLIYLMLSLLNCYGGLELGHIYGEHSYGTSTIKKHHPLMAHDRSASKYGENYTSKGRRGA